MTEERAVIEKYNRIQWSVNSYNTPWSVCGQLGGRHSSAGGAQWRLFAPSVRAMRLAEDAANGPR